MIISIDELSMWFTRESKYTCTCLCRRRIDALRRCSSFTHTLMYYRYGLLSNAVHTFTPSSSSSLPFGFVSSEASLAGDANRVIKDEGNASKRD